MLQAPLVDVRQRNEDPPQRRQQLLLVVVLEIEFEPLRLQHVLEQRNCPALDSFSAVHYHVLATLAVPGGQHAVDGLQPLRCVPMSGHALAVVLQ